MVPQLKLVVSIAKDCGSIAKDCGSISKDCGSITKDYGSIRKDLVPYRNGMKVFAFLDDSQGSGTAACWKKAASGAGRLTSSSSFCLAES